MQRFAYLAIFVLLSNLAFAVQPSNSDEALRMIEDAVVQELVDEVMRGELDPEIEAPIVKKLQEGNSDTAELPPLHNSNQSTE